MGRDAIALVFCAYPGCSVACLYSPNVVQFCDEHATPTPEELTEVYKSLGVNTKTEEV